MSPEKFAFISTYYKNGLDVLAPAVSKAGYEIVSLGGTAKLIEGLHVPVIATDEFIDPGIDPDKLLDLEEREQREIVGAHLAQLMSVRRTQLHATNRNTIDFTYINLMPPDKIYDEEGRLGYKRDKGGILMLEAALEGSRTVLTTPDQIPVYVQYLETGVDDIREKESFRLRLAREANEYLVEYAAQTSDIR